MLLLKDPSHRGSKHGYWCRIAGIAIGILTCHALLGSAEAGERPNFVIIFTDDQGYGDLGCFGSQTINTPNIDQLATEGRRFTSFMVASSVCTPSRAALLTGCYPKRVGLHQHVLFPASKKGLHPDEYTLADHLKSQGYATACFGKWHLGHHPETLPRQNGFDTYWGIPYSNDMNHPDNTGRPTLASDQLWQDQATAVTQWNTPLIENETIIELPVDQRTITRRYTDHAIDFIADNQEEPFFVYLPHSMPHIPLYVPEDAYDADPKQAYTCVIEHIDQEVGRIIHALREHKLADNTYVIFTSDNGPWLQFKHHGGSAGPLRAGKGTTFEGGQRVPCVMWAPGRIPAGTSCDELFTTMDLLPTIASLIGNPLPEGNAIDGMNLSEHLTSKTPAAKRDTLLYYSANGHLEGIRQDNAEGQWKLLLKRNQTLLFDLSNDLAEQHNLAAKHPDKVAQLQARMQADDRAITTAARAPWMKLTISEENEPK